MSTTIEIDGLKFTGYKDGEITIERVNELRKSFVITNQDKKAFVGFLAKVMGPDYSKVIAPAHRMAAAGPLEVPLRMAEQPTPARAASDSKPKSVIDEHPKRIAKESHGWGVDIRLASGEVVRYFYEKRDQARTGIFSDEIGYRGRTA